MLGRIWEARQHSKESNHTLDVENGGSRSSTHLLRFVLSEVDELRPRGQLKAHGAD